ncbi:hypothetical protein THAOC_32617 [Thalassiosira oceanica]|uniref:PDZ domain-containing protein n=1 Tax=Thalassiosira oceanica TaxID=159749 RepID=K0R6S9_THAOC|nr:hypothetical protein THAOC_32617 [Thalassiosira oceanica]|eukprot:EJK48575.1 hypothetical protein THAOC_32617 [Thalassiosira oceanica]
MSNASTSLIDDDDESDESIAEEEAPAQDQGPQQQREGLVSRALGGIMTAAPQPQEDYRTQSSSVVIPSPPPSAGGTSGSLPRPRARSGSRSSEDIDSSPLSGWIFPSDVLAAVDGVSADGLRHRDVVGLLAAGGAGGTGTSTLCRVAVTEADDARRRGPGTV